MRTKKQSCSTKKAVATSKANRTSRFSVLKIAPVAKSDRTVNFMRWEDASARVDFVIKGGWGSRFDSK